MITAAASSRFRDRLRRFDPDAVRAAWVTLGFQTVLTIFGLLAEEVFTPLQKSSEGGLPGNPSPLRHTAGWDAGFFRGIPHGLYESDPQSAAFYPLFPMLARGVEIAGFGLLTPLAAGLVLNTVATWAAVVALLKIVRHVIGSDSAAWTAVAVMLTAPTAFYLHSYYSEATFMALGFSAYAFALRGRWLFMGLCLMPLTASRITALLFVGLCFLEFWRSKGWRIRGLVTPAVLWFPAATVGFCCYAVYLHFALDDSLAMFHAYSAGDYWSYHEFDPNIPGLLVDEFQVAGESLFGSEPTDNYTLANTVLPLAGLLLLLASCVTVLVLLRSDGIPLAAFGVASFVMFTLNDNLVSVHRYMLPALVVYVAVAGLMERRPGTRPVVQGLVYVNAMLQAILLTFFVSGHWAG